MLERQEDERGRQAKSMKDFVLLRVMCCRHATWYGFYHCLSAHMQWLHHWNLSTWSIVEVSHEKKLTFHCTSCLIGILISYFTIMPTCRISSPTNTLNNQGPCFHCSTDPEKTSQATIDDSFDNWTCHALINIRLRCFWLKDMVIRKGKVGNSMRPATGFRKCRAEVDSVKLWNILKYFNVNASHQQFRVEFVSAPLHS